MKLTNKIILIFSTSIIVAFSALTVILLPEYFRIVEEAAIVDASHQVNTLAQGVGAFFRERKREAAVLSEYSEVQSMNFIKMRPKLMSFLSSNVDNIEKVIIGDKKGRFYNTSGGNPRQGLLRTSNDLDPNASPKSIAKRDYWKVTVGSNSFNERRVYISEPMISYTTGVKQVVVASSIKKDGAILGLVGLTVTWERVQRLIDKLKYKFLSLENPRVFLISQTGAYWYHWDEEKVVGLLKEGDKVVKDEIGQTISQVQKIVEEKNPDLVYIGNKMILEEVGYQLYMAGEQERYIFYRRIPGTTYSLGLDIEKNTVMSALSKFRSTVIPIIILVYLVILSILSVLARTLITPFKEITEQAGKLLNSNKIDYLDTSAKSDNLVNLLRDSINNVIGQLKEKEHSLKDSEKRLALAFDASRDGVWDWDLRSNNVKYSPRWFEMLGYEENELPQVLSTFETLIYEGDRQRVMKLLDKYLSGEEPEYNTRIRFRCKDGSLKWILARGRIIEESNDGTPLRMLGTHVDIDEQVKYENKISELNRSLEIKVNERTSELVKTLQKVSDAKTEAEAANDAKSMFLANMSHEIRTPLNAIIGMTQILLDSNIDSDKKNELKTILESGNLLLTLINDVLDLSKIESGTLELSQDEFCIESIIEESAKIMAPVIHKKGIEFIVKNDLGRRYKVKGDPERIKQIILNFIGNSLKFTDSGFIRLSINEELGNFKIMVEDTGIGISKLAREKIFKPFIQEDISTTKKYGGTGLGLTICKKIAEMMNGRINFVSEEGEGSRFWVEIPIDILERQEYQYSQETIEYLENKKVLIYEEMKENREIIRRLLKNYQMDISIGTKLESFTEKVTSFKFDYVILSFDSIQKSPKLRELIDSEVSPKFIITSASNSPKLKELEKKKSVISTLQKPLLNCNLNSFLESLLEKNQVSEEITQAVNLDDLSSHKVLVVDDNLINLKVAAGFLKKFKVEPVTVTSGADCLKELMREDYDLVFMDVHMPEMNGLDTTKEIRADEKYGRPYIIALTALAMKGDAEKCVEVGMNDYLSKPLKIKDLKEALKKFKLSI